MRIGLICIFLFASLGLAAQFNDAIGEISEAESKRAWFSSHNRSDQTPIDRSYFDVVYQTLSISVDPAVQYVNGSTRIQFNVLADGVQEIVIDLSSKLQCDSVTGDHVASFKHEDGYITIRFATALNAGAKSSVDIFYQGVPNAGRAFLADTNANGDPVMWTLSEPYGAKEWWPCKQDLQDKIDTFEMKVTTPDQYTVAANGPRMAEVNLGGGLKRTDFKHEYPMVVYLVAFAVADYAVFTDSLDYRGGKLPFINYIYPQDTSKALEDLRGFPNTLMLFDSLFGPYPFLKEHYGHAQFTWGGGMEHQTMSFMVRFNHALVAHELAHQWFGDQITCGSWEDLWLNEGFATYLEGLTYEFNFTDNSWWGWREFNHRRILTNIDGSVWIPDTTDVARMFNPELTYRKGAYLLHMLRWKLGDENFFATVRDYLNDPKLNYGFARTDDLKRHLENRSGQNLDEFFKDWYYSKGYPHYHIKWYQNEQNKLYLVVNQDQSHVWEGTYFDMILPVQVLGNGLDTVLRLDNTYEGQEFIIDLDKPLTDIVFDPELWIIAGDRIMEEVNYRHELIGYKVAPNPVEDQLWVTVSAPNLPNNHLEIYDIHGKRVWDGIGVQGLSTRQFSVDVSGLRGGVYFLKVRDFYRETTLKFIKL